MAEFGDVGLNPLIDYDRLEVIERIADEAQVDLEVRHARREAGLEPETWRRPPKPEPEEVRALPQTLQVGRLVDGIYEHLEQRLVATGSMIGEELATAEKAMRAEFKKEIDRTIWGLRHEVTQNLQRSAAEILKQREIRESAMVEIKQELLGYRRELLELREQLAEIRVSRSKALNGGGLHADR